MEDSKEMDDTQQAWNYYKQGKYADSLAMLNKVCFPTFDVQEMKIENNKLICRAQSYLLNQDNQNLDDILQDLSSLLQTVSGLPLNDVMMMRCRLCVSINTCILQLQLQSVKSVTIIDELIANLRNCLTAVALALTDQELKTDSIYCDFTTIISNIFSKIFGCKDQMVELIPDLWNACCLIAALFLFKNEEDAAAKLLNLLQPSNLTSNESSKGDIFISLLADNCMSRITLEWLSLLGNKLLQQRNIIIAFILYRQEKFESSLRQLSEGINETAVAHLLRGFNYYKLSHYDEAFNCFKTVCLQSNNHYNAIAFNMIGCCYVLQKKYTTSLLNYKEALTKDFNHMEPLLNIAEAFHMTGENEKEVQTLQFLTNINRNQTGMPTAASYNMVNCKLVLNSYSNWRTMADCIGQFRLVSTPDNNFTDSVLLCSEIATRFLRSKRYSEASELYMNCLSNVKTNWKSEALLSPVISNISNIYLLAIVSLLCSCKYDDALIICNYFLSIIQDSAGQIEEDAKNSPAYAEYVPDISDTSHFKKRKVAARDLPIKNIRLFVQALLVKADALYHQRHLSEANSLLMKALVIVNKVLPASNDSSTREESDEDNLHEYLTSMAIFKSRILNNIALIKINQGELRDGLLMLQDSFHFNTANREAAYNYTVLLFILERRTDACFSWLKYRNIDTVENREKLIKEVRDNLAMLESSTDTQQTSSFYVSDYMALQLDIYCLQECRSIPNTSNLA